MKNFFVLILCSMALNVFAGGEGSGGGDPIAAKFSVVATYISDFLAQNPDVYPEASRPALKKVAKEIASNLNVNSKVGKVEVVDDFSADDLMDPFIKAEANPINITISRFLWKAMSAQQLLEAITKVMITLASVKDMSLIPQPESPINSYVNAYETCTTLTEKAGSLYTVYHKLISQCSDANRLQVVPAQAKIDIEFRATVKDCLSLCQYHQQKINGGQICQQYLTIHIDNIKGYATSAPGCLRV